MQKVDKHISELLYEHDCVIVPDFGGFVSNYNSAAIHPVQHTFTPPSKKIVFNVNLNNNDGLLANRIVIAENTNYPEAIRYISRFVEYTNAELKKGTKVKIDEVGTLFLDVERNIQFEPSSTNYLLQSFGLPSFQSPAIKRDNIGKRIEKEFKDRGPVAQERKKLNVKRMVTLAIVTPLVFGLIWIPLKTDLLKNVNYSDLNPFAHSKSGVTIPAVKAPKTASLPKQGKAVAAYPVKKVDTTASVTENNAQPNEVESVKPDSTLVKNEKNATLDFKFHVVAGCFSIESNAINFVASLQQQNIEAAIIGKNNKNLFVVSCGNYATFKEANQHISALRKQLPDLWLYKN
jgi:cell division septation protein DedD